MSAVRCEVCDRLTLTTRPPAWAEGTVPDRVIWHLLRRGVRCPGSGRPVRLHADQKPPEAS